MDFNTPRKELKVNGEIRAIDEILNQKRKEIDQDIADFTAEKENEYNIFEKMLRAQRGPTIDEESLQNILNMRGVKEDSGITKHQKESRLPIGVKEEMLMNRNSNGTQLHSVATNISKHPEHIGSLGIFTSIDPASPSDSAASKGTPVHEREAEFRGLFTPSYLPLLDNVTHDFTISPRKHLFTQTRPKEGVGLLRSSPSITSSQTAEPIRMISSSASAENIHSSSPNVPLGESSHLRRSLSPSDTRRSSLRDPKHPRSSKHVLFSIDNVVVSPITAPLKQRTNSIPRVQSSELDNIPQGFEKIAAGTIKGETHQSGGLNGTNLRSNKSSSLPTDNATLYKSRPFRRSSNLKGGVSFVTSDDFETVDYEDDLFTFDEDVGMGELEHADKSHGDFGSDEEEDKKDIDVSSSPHAGSLPIEIKWPVRQDPRK